MMNSTTTTMATPISRAKRLVKLLERLLRKRELFDDEQFKLIKEQLRVAKDELALIEKKYESMDSVLIQRLEDIKFEFGYSEMLVRINEEKKIRIDSVDSKRPKMNIELEKMLIQYELDSLNNVLGFHRRSLDTLRSLSRYKFYLNQPRFGQ